MVMICIIHTCPAVKAGFYSDAVECRTATQEILVRSSAGKKVV